MHIPLCIWQEHSWNQFILNISVSHIKSPLFITGLGSKSKKSYTANENKHHPITNIKPGWSICDKLHLVRNGDSMKC